MSEVKLAHFKGPALPDFLLPDKSFGELILAELKKVPDQLLYVDLPSGREVTRGEVFKNSVALGNGLWKLGYEKGDCCCICSYNLPECPVAFYGSDAVGMATMWCNALYSSFEMNHQLKDSNSSLLFIPGNKSFIEKSLPAIEGTKVKMIILLTDPDFDLSEVLASSKTEILLMREVLNFSTDDQSVVPPFERDLENDVATLLYSSGTTGLSKGVIITQFIVRYFLKRMKISELLKPTIDDNSRATVFAVPPMFHIYGMIVGALYTPYGLNSLVMQRRFNFKGMLEAIPKYNIESLILVPAILTQMVKESVDSETLKSVKVVACGAAALPKETVDGIYELFGPENPPTIIQAYGMTEGGGSVIPPTASREIVTSGTVGQVEPDGEMKIVDLKTLETVPVNVEGEIWSKPKTIMKGYLNRPEETAKTITEDGWLRTGDIGYFREDGYLFITDRLKELVKYKGYQVPPAELEAVLLLHPDVRDAGVTGKPDEDAGQLPIAFVALKAGVESNEEKTHEIQQFVKERVAPYKQLKGGVHFVPDVPRNPAGKVLRRKLISTFLSE